MTPILRTGKDFNEIVAAAELGEEAVALHAEQQDPAEFVDALVQNGLSVDTIRLLAHALPRREAVWWAWSCASKVAGEEPAEVVQAALDATREWIADPSDEHGQNAMEKAEQADMATPAGCAALAAFLSGNSLAPPGIDPVVPGEFVGAKAVSGCIILAGVAREPEKAEEKYVGFIEEALGVAAKVKLFQPPDDAEAQTNAEE